ncbi:MAG: OmpP1/FadL family transporter [Oligoflexus sp.]
MKRIVHSAFLVGSLFVSCALQADQFHYNNLVVGERAMGLAGAFTAVADDASGVIYNPAGLGFALSNDITGSANAFYRRQIVYKDTIGGEDFTEKSGGTTAPFFGGLQKLDDIYPGLVAAFGIFNLDSELKDQDDLFVDKDFINLRRFHRTANIRSGTLGLGAAMGLRLMPGFSIGVGMSYLMIDELVQEYQDVVYTDDSFLTQNYRTHLSSNAIENSIGAQLALGSLSFGMNIKLRTIVTENFDISRDLWTNRDDGDILDTPLRAPLTVSIKKPLEKLPTEIRFGTAWFASTSLLWTADVIHNTEAKSVYFSRNAVTNFATGIEYYITPSIPIRTGVLTNFDARPEVKAEQLNQPDHIDYLGYSLFFALVQPNSQIAFGGIYQEGEGKAQKTAGSAIQNVEAESLIVAFSATHSF